MFVEGEVYGEKKMPDTESFRKLNDRIACARVEKIILPGATATDSSKK